MRPTMKKYRIYYPPATVERGTTERSCGGRSIVDSSSLHFQQLCSLREFVALQEKCFRSS